MLARIVSKRSVHARQSIHTSVNEEEEVGKAAGNGVLIHNVEVLKQMEKAVLGITLLQGDVRA